MAEDQAAIDPIPSAMREAHVIIDWRHATSGSKLCSAREYLLSAPSSQLALNVGFGFRGYNVSAVDNSANSF